MDHMVSEVDHAAMGNIIYDKNKCALMGIVVSEWCC